MDRKETKKTRDTLFYCQKCGAALKLDPNLATLPDKEILDEITGENG